MGRELRNIEQVGFQISRVNNKPQREKMKSSNTGGGLSNSFGGGSINPISWSASESERVSNLVSCVCATRV